MSTHALLNLFYKLRKRDKCEALSPFCNKFDKFNNTRVQMFVCIGALFHRQQFFSHVGTLSCVPEPN